MNTIAKIVAGVLAIGSIFQSNCTCAPSEKNIRLDGSSTVYVVSEAIAEEFKKEHEGDISIGISGTGGGFKKLCSGRVNLIGASRRIKDSEKILCAENAMEVSEFSVAIDGIVVAVNHENKWLNSIKLSMLKKLFEPSAEGKILKWSDLDKNYPDRKLEIFSPGVSSGTYDYFTTVVTGTEHASRGDVTASEDDNVLVHGVFSNVDSIGFFSYAYYIENREKLKALSVIDDRSGGSTAVFPSKDSIHSGAYTPLSRPIFIYANQKNLNPASKKFLRFYLENCAKVAEDVGFIPLPPHEQQKNFDKLVGP